MACDNIIDYYSGSEDHSRYFNENPVGDNVGQAFRMGETSRDICAAKFRMVVTAAAGADMIAFAAKIYACTGTPGTDGMQTGEALAASDPIEYTDNTAPSWVEFTFSTPFTLNANTNYCIVLECTGWVEETYTEGVTSSDESSPTHDGNLCYNIDGIPGYNANEDYNFYAYSAGWSGKLNGITPSKVNGVANIGKIIGV
ncbi:hypothetical protein KAR04_00215 [Candidatus Calescamantes bacterium]|jgi:hypothetical protein|nr:hypothetical protein [Candidatus Calescamantes bacterium]